MGDLTNIAKVIGGMPILALIAVVILAAFGLAAYAIAAVVKVSRSRPNGE